MPRTDFAGEPDLVAMQQMCSRVWSPTARFHPGQLAWNHYSRAAVPGVLGDGEAVSVWRGADQDASQVVAFGWAEAADWLEVALDEDRDDAAELASQVIAWYTAWTDSPTQNVLTMEGSALAEPLIAAGFSSDESNADAMYLRHLLLDLARLDSGAGAGIDAYDLRPVQVQDIPARAECHDLAWSDFGDSGVTAHSYRLLTESPLYRYDLDWVAVSPSGELAASALAWLDEATGVGLLEPVGVVPAHRGRGLSEAVSRAALHQLQRLGARTALVTARGDEGYPGPRKLYARLGFQPGARTVTWSRCLG